MKKNVEKMVTYLTRSCYCYGIYIGFMVCGEVLYFFLIVESGGAC